MTVTIGRASLTDIFDVRLSGRRLTFTTDIEAASADEMKAIRQQLAGLVDNRDEEVIPFTWSDDPTLDGYYRVASVNVPSTEVMLTSGFIPDVEVELEQIPGFANPWFEVTYQAVVLTNAHSITTPTGTIAAPSDTTDVQSYEWGSLSPGIATAVADGSARFSSFAAPRTLTSFRYATTPAAFYVGGCQIEVKYGSTWFPVVGRQIPRNTVWRISNGVTRLTSANGATSGTLEIYDTTAAAWQSTNVKHLVAGASQGIGLGDGTNQPAVTILRNSPEQVAVRVTGPTDASAVGSISMTYSLGRGSSWVTASWTADIAIAVGPAATSATAMTLTTPLLYSTSSDANGNKLALTAAHAFTSDTTNGRLYGGVTSGSTSSGQHGFYLHPEGGVLIAPTAPAIARYWFCAISQTQRVIAR